MADLAEIAEEVDQGEWSGFICRDKVMVDAEGYERYDGEVAAVTADGEFVLVAVEEMRLFRQPVLVATWHKASECHVIKESIVKRVSSL